MVDVIRMVGDINRRDTLLFQLHFIDSNDSDKGAAQNDNDDDATAAAAATTTTTTMSTEVASADPYELKLYQMFQSCCDCSGTLDEPALRALCESLELHDKGAPLIAGLVKTPLADSEKTVRVSFLSFKEALLNFLGTELDGTASSAAPTKHQLKATNNGSGNGRGGSGGGGANIAREHSLVIADDVEAYVDSPPEQSDREVSPKLVVGGKKYGRRSRPQVQPLQDELALTDSDHGLGTEEAADDSGLGGRGSHRDCSFHLAQRSSSQTDIPSDGSSGGRRRRPPTLNGTKLKRCSSLPAQRNLQAPKTAPKALAKNAQAQPLGSSVESLGAETRQHLGPWNGAAVMATYSNGRIYSTTNRSSARDAPAQLETLPAHSIVDIWERAQIANGRGILLALGFDENDVNLVQLHKVLEEELRGGDDDEPHTTMLLRASHALQSTELQSLRQIQRQLHDENAKLRADNKDANRRVAMLAVEIDERHASLEDAAQKEMRLLEQRHAAVVRELTTRMANDREQLMARLKNFELDEIRLKTDVELVRKENDALEEEHQKLQRQITKLLEDNIQLNRELSEVAERLQSGQRSSSKTVAGDSVTSIKSDESDDELMRLMDKVAALGLENTELRDKNDELVVEVENLNLELVRAKTKLKKSASVPPRTDLNLTDGDDDGEQAGSAIAVKRRGDSPSKTRISEEESPRLGKLRKCANEAGASEAGSDASGEWMALNSELQNSVAAVDTSAPHVDLVGLKKKVVALEEQLRLARQSVSFATPPSDTGSVSPTADERCKELESSLEQMQRAYEDCEDYWQSKLSEERQRFEKERQIYEDEQQENDRKFTDLMEKVREYEEQFNKDGRLSPIEEKDLLEQQYADLEAEIEEMRAQSRLVFEEKCKEVDTLQCEVEDLRLRLGESVEILTGACQLNTEAVQAAAATGAVDTQSPASSPISYLWHQSTIQEPAKNYSQHSQENSCSTASLGKQANRINLSTSETTIFSTTPVDAAASSPSISSSVNTISPIQKPNASANNHRSTLAIESEGDAADCDSSSTASGRSFETHSIGSTHSAQLRAQAAQNANDTNHTTATTTTTTTATAKTTTTTSQNDNNSCTSPSPSPSLSASGIKDELKRLKFFQISLKEQIKDLSLQRDGLVMELQQLQEARPVLEKAYARAAHPSLIQRVNQLELKNRHLQNVIKQQQQYTESLMQQSWHQHQMELSDLHGRIEAQGSMITEHVQRLQNADILVKDLYVENSHLTATVQRMEQQRMRVNIMHHQQQSQHQQPLVPPSGRAHVLPGMP